MNNKFIVFGVGGLVLICIIIFVIMFFSNRGDDKEQIPFFDMSASKGSVGVSSLIKYQYERYEDYPSDAPNVFLNVNLVFSGSDAISAIKNKWVEKLYVFLYDTTETPKTLMYNSAVSFDSTKTIQEYNIPINIKDINGKFDIGKIYSIEFKYNITDDNDKKDLNVSFTLPKSDQPDDVNEWNTFISSINNYQSDEEVIDAIQDITELATFTPTTSKKSGEDIIPTPLPDPDIVICDEEGAEIFDNVTIYSKYILINNNIRVVPTKMVSDQSYIKLLDADGTDQYLNTGGNFDTVGDKFIIKVKDKIVLPKPFIIIDDNKAIHPNNQELNLSSSKTLVSDKQWIILNNNTRVDSLDSIEYDSGYKLIKTAETNPQYYLSVPNENFVSTTYLLVQDDEYYKLFARSENLLNLREEETPTESPGKSIGKESPPPVSAPVIPKYYLVSTSIDGVMWMIQIAPTYDRKNVLQYTVSNKKRDDTKATKQEWLNYIKQKYPDSRIVGNTINYRNSGNKYMFLRDIGKGTRLAERSKNEHDFKFEQV